MNILKPVLENLGHRLCVNVRMGKSHNYVIRGIFQTDKEANDFMAANPGTSLIDEDQYGNKYIVETEEIN